MKTGLASHLSEIQAYNYMFKECFLLGKKLGGRDPWSQNVSDPVGKLEPPAAGGKPAGRSWRMSMAEEMIPDKGWGRWGFRTAWKKNWHA